ncbi:MAG: BlaI/MecI/CopY family transcriptional regulator [Gemmatimonadota bacterium]|nr:MAG: BlaI/MecI/CopY family transcriptional regulator [Gemmatimonadota bacterium]
MGVQLTNRELDVMSIVWRLGSATVNEVQEELGDRLAYTSVMTMLKTLESKGHLRHELEGRAYRYYPQVEPSAAGAKTLNRLLDKVYQGSRAMLVAELVADERVSPEELRRMKELLDKRLEEMEP